MYVMSLCFEMAVHPALYRRQTRDSAGSYLALPQAAGCPCNAAFLELWATHLSQPELFIGHYLAVVFLSPASLPGFWMSCSHCVYMTPDKAILLPSSDYDPTTEVQVRPTKIGEVEKLKTLIGIGELRKMRLGVQKKNCALQCNMKSDSLKLKHSAFGAVVLAESRTRPPSSMV